MRRSVIVPALVGGALLGAALLMVGSAASAPLRALTAPTVSSFTPTSGPFGTQVTVHGAHFTGATSVTFNGTEATNVAVSSDLTLSATVAPGSTTGKVAVVTAGGAGTSAGSFTVKPGVANVRTCAATNAQSDSPPNGDSAFACSVDQGATSFAPGDALMCSFETYNAAGHTVTSDWTRNGATVSPTAIAGGPDFPGDGVHAYWSSSFIQDPTIATGSWTCRIKIDGTVAATRSFTVVSSATKVPLTVDAEYLDSLDPTMAYTTESWRVLSPTCAGLLAWKDGSSATDAQTLFPDAATALPTVSSNGLTYTFTIRSGMQFAPSGNGSVTPSSFVRAFQRAARVPNSPAGQFASPISGFDAYASGSASSISGLMVTGSQLKITLAAKSGNFLARLAMPFFCAVPASEPLTAQTTVPSAGPYFLAPGADVNTGAQLLLNPHYGGHRPHGAPAIDIVVTSTARYGIETDAVDAGFTFSPADWSDISAQYGSGASKRAFQWPGSTISQLTFDTAKEYMTPNVRKAIATALNRTALASADGATPISNLLSPNEAGYSASGPYALSANVPAARTLMANAGYTSGHRLALTLATCPSSKCAARGALLATQLSQIFIDLTVDQVSNLYVFLAGSDWDIGATGWQPDFSDPWDNLGPLFGTGGAGNFSKYSNAGFDSALVTADGKTGTNRANAFATLATNLATGDAPATTYEVNNDTGFFSTRIKCVTYGAFGVNLALLNDKNTGATCGSDASE